jgi:Domain of unknown function (DUF2017)
MNTARDRLVDRAPDGRYRLRLKAEERNLLRTLPAQLLAILGTDDPALRRLHPPAYQDDPEREAEYRRMVGDDLLEQRREALRIMADTVDAESLAPEEMSAWLGALNDLRLVLGTRLDVTEELVEEGVPDDDPRAPAFALFGYLGWLEERIVEAVASGR